MIKVMLAILSLSAVLCFGLYSAQASRPVAPDADIPGMEPSSGIGYCSKTTGHCPIYTMKCICGGQTWYSCDSISTPYKITC